MKNGDAPARPKERLGVVIACCNPGEKLDICLSHVFQSTIASQLYVVIVDDASTDGSVDRARASNPGILVIPGDGNMWWAGASNLGIQACLAAGCAAVVLLNPDVIVGDDAFALLWATSNAMDEAIVAPLVLDEANRDLIWEAGHSWEPVIRWLPLFWRSRYLYEHLSPAASIPDSPYATVSIVGRGGFFPRRAFEVLGLLDDHHFPQYGADAVMGVVAWQARYPMYIVPAAKVYLDCRHTGMQIDGNEANPLRSFIHYLFKRKNGERLRVLWFQSLACVPWYAVVPNYLFWVALNSFRYWQRVWSAKSRKQK